MINMRRTLLALALALAAAAAATAPLSAQVYTTRVVAPRGWLGITYDETIRINGTERTGAVTITEVMKGSPAERAGVQKGDTLIRVNNFRATTEMVRSLGGSVEPGDTVHFVVQRGGREHTLAIEVAKRPPETFTTSSYFIGKNGTYTFDPDSVRGMMRLFVDSMVAGLDTSRMRIFRMDTTIMLPGKGLFLRDSLMTHGGMFFADSLMRTLPRIDMRADLPPGLFEMELHTPDVVFRSIARSENAFAGADLTEVNAELGEYFGTRSGVLVLRVPEDTPAGKAGLEPGDIVTKINGTSVASMTELRRAVESTKRGTPIKLEIIRHKKSYSLELKRE
ncbi:MAG: PDZ domain-containing protein [Longimicrobiales bacterium]